MINTPAPTPKAQSLAACLASTRSLVAVALLFAVNGMVVGGYGGALPSIRVRLEIDSTQIAFLLGAAGLSAIISMQIGGRLADSIGARQVALGSLPLLIAAPVAFAFATTYVVAVLGAVLLGLGNGALDMAMNALGVQVEGARQRPVMSFLHALWSVGSFAGAGCVVLLATLSGRNGPAIVMPLMLLMAFAAFAAFAVACVIAPPTAVIRHRVDGMRTRIPNVAWLLALMAVGFGLAEGTAYDWSSLQVTEVAQVDSTTGALGFVAVSGTMVLIRLVGDRLVERFGRGAVVRFGGGCAGVGYLAVTLVSGLAPLIIGWLLVGLGVGMIAPQVYAVAGHAGGGRVLAIVVTFGYAAFLVGPAVMGFFVSRIGLHHAMVVPALLCMGIVGLAGVMPRGDSEGEGYRLTPRDGLP
ncbi:MFS transporter [Phycicoccus sp. Soil803]|uniref:MFS transporter n=1 Tax=Phycicoccus sp. Soil803 TaxID=1736415 RepID=UPI00070D0E26|nr:MFS transporter [Phycicoccus sp. Soil803]KRF24379.1 MFS transporter [Phycicoccus sp. Soil803]